MKKIFALTLALLMAVSLAACGGSAEPTAPATEAPTEAPAVALEGTLEEIIARIYEQHPVELALGAIPVDLTDTSEDGLWTLTRFTGLETAEGITEVAVSEAMIGSVAYSMVLVRAEDAANTKAVAEAMKAGIDPAKWICVIADDMAVCGYGDVAMLVMLGSELGAEIGTTAQDLVDAFQTVCGGQLDFVLE